MPGRGDVGFMAVLEGHVPDMVATSRQSGVSHDPHATERPVHVVWAPSICYITPTSQRPACILITTENIHILHVVAIKGHNGLPELDHVYCIPLMNVQQIVLGHHNLFIRVEEAFVGPQGTVTLLMGSANKTDLFLDSLKLAYRRAAPDLDQYEDPHVVNSAETDVNLRATLNSEEKLLNASSVNVLMYMLVHATDVEPPSLDNYVHSLVITANRMYLLREDYIAWPQPTFAIGPSSRPQFEIVVSVPILGKITGIQMYDTDIHSPEKEGSLSQTFEATNSSSMLVSHFIGYGLKLTFDLGQDGIRIINVRVTTSGMRDKILATLTQARKELTDRCSPSPGKKRSRHRGEKKSGRKSASVKYEDDNSPSVSEDSMSGGFLPEQRDSPTGASSNTLESLADSTENETESKQHITAEEGASAAGDTTEGGHKEGKVIETPTMLASPIRQLLVPQVRKTIPPQHLNVVYPNLELLTYLTRCNSAQKPLLPLSEQLQTLASMDGEEILNYFHSNIAQISFENEELHHILWTQVVPYCNPQQEILSCVLLSTSAVYFLSDEVPVPQKTERIPQTRRGHSRNRSDQTHYLPQPSKAAKHHVSGIIHEGKKGAVMSYHILPLKELKEILIGLFDQYFRLVGQTASSVFSCICRDSQLTEMFVRRLMGVLSRVHPSPSPDPLGESGSEQDFYKMFSKQISQSETQEYIHPSRVRFLYPNDDLISDITFLIAEGAQSKRLDTLILSYALVFTEKMDSVGGGAKQYQPRSLALTQNFIALLREDFVNYPLPHFANSPPLSEHHIVQQVREISSLKQIVATNTPGAKDLTLVFLSVSDQIEVDPSKDHYGTQTTAANKTRREYSWSLVVQAEHERQRLIKAIRQQWSVIRDGQELPLETSMYDSVIIK